ncbi:MAG: hypothetical protein AABZ00_09420 [Chloroflexota bacterium]
MNYFLRTLAAVGLLLTAGCRGNSVSIATLAASTQPAAPREIIPQTPPPDSGFESDNNGVNMPDLTTTPDPNAQQVIQIAMNNLAKKLQINADQIRISSMEAVTWPDGSLGCPQLGGMYTQVITPGYKLILEANGKPYPYHTDDKETVILCALRSGGEYFISPTP